eukprot:CAMPEP_0175051796 /NCGR_PEP_ID=MMETSP0052_2-20121109/8005_1 /TAXON_ID=51329 ORGANISM="Polytomella parva, Strain SAG 63-3" /NCGR_SAMPLE_ID=MMETSP0052_2 /ASSEMBLY_ACC=CAM_ASM_000194 /LENGTH=1065 /DNA_ID=CAMNT_0016316133 /DNA_START=41 /DNA_END=3235 /DNA_ORIENTATION=-
MVVVPQRPTREQLAEIGKRKLEEFRRAKSQQHKGTSILPEASLPPSETHIASLVISPSRSASLLRNNLLTSLPSCNGSSPDTQTVLDRAPSSFLASDVDRLSVKPLNSEGLFETNPPSGSASFFELSQPLQQFLPLLPPSNQTAGNESSVASTSVQHASLSPPAVPFHSIPKPSSQIVAAPPSVGTPSLSHSLSPNGPIANVPFSSPLSSSTTLPTTDQSFVHLFPSHHSVLSSHPFVPSPSPEFPPPLPATLLSALHPFPLGALESSSSPSAPLSAPFLVPSSTSPSLPPTATPSIFPPPTTAVPLPHLLPQSPGSERGDDPIHTGGGDSRLVTPSPTPSIPSSPATSFAPGTNTSTPRMGGVLGFLSRGRTVVGKSFGFGRFGAESSSSINPNYAGNDTGSYSCSNNNSLHVLSGGSVENNTSAVDAVKLGKEPPKQMREKEEKWEKINKNEEEARDKSNNYYKQNSNIKGPFMLNKCASIPHSSSSSSSSSSPRPISSPPLSSLSPQPPLQKDADEEVGVIDISAFLGGEAAVDVVNKGKSTTDHDSRRKSEEKLRWRVGTNEKEEEDNNDDVFQALTNAFGAFVNIVDPEPEILSEGSTNSSMSNCANKSSNNPHSSHHPTEVTIPVEKESPPPPLHHSYPLSSPTLICGKGNGQKLQEGVDEVTKTSNHQSMMDAPQKDDDDVVSVRNRNFPLFPFNPLPLTMEGVEEKRKLTDTSLEYQQGHDNFLSSSVRTLGLLKEKVDNATGVSMAPASIPLSPITTTTTIIPTLSADNQIPSAPLTTTSYPLIPTSHVLTSLPPPSITPSLSPSSTSSPLACAASQADRDGMTSSIEHRQSSAHRQQMTWLRNLVDELTEEKLSLERALAKQTRISNGLTEELREAVATTRRHQGHAEDLKKKVTTLEAHIEAGAVTLETLHSERDVARSAAAEATGRAQSLAAEVVTLEAQLMQAKSSVLRLEQKVKDEASRAAKAEHRLLDAEATITTTKAATADAVSSGRQARIDLRRAELATKALQERVEELEAERKKWLASEKRGAKWLGGGLFGRKGVVRQEEGGWKGG